MNHHPISRRDALKLVGAGAATTALSTAPVRYAQAQDASPVTQPAGELTIGKAQEAVGLDPALVTAASSFQIIAPVYNQLVRFDANNQPQPALAESWENPDDTTFIFTLREGVTFHNGRAMTAEDVKYSLERIANPDTTSPWASQLEPVETIETPDDRTVRIALKQPYGPLLATLGSPWAAIVPREEVEKTGDLQSTMAGTGPFRLTEYTADTRTVMGANTAYWEAGLPKLEQLIWSILPDESSRLAAIRTGEIGLTSLADAASVDLASQSEGVQVINQETTDYYLLGLNTKEPPFDNVAVRQAISLAVDRQAILDTIFFGRGSITGPIVPTLGDWGIPVDQLPLYGRDLDRARDLLAEAGVADGFEMDIVASPLYPEFINIALVLQQQLQEVGITANLDQVEWGTFIERWRARDFQSFVSFNGSGNDPDRALYPAFHTDGSVNAFQFSDQEVDELLEQGRTTLDPAQRQEIYRQAEQKIAEAAPAIFISTRLAYFAHRDDVQGFNPNPINTWDTLKQTTVGGA
ncbi:MAG TPA: ABC transporter substrate-binding protein [Thermomicrobiales bacterium]|nr:ABC transporter substrate-binding protein [Thermomicrobiales bacterium]